MKNESYINLYVFHKLWKMKRVMVQQKNYAEKQSRIRRWKRIVEWQKSTIIWDVKIRQVKLNHHRKLSHKLEMKWIDLAVVDWQRRAYILVPDENSQKGPTRKLPSRCASTGQEGSIDLAMDLLPREIAGCACAANAGKVLPATD